MQKFVSARDALVVLCALSTVSMLACASANPPQPPASGVGRAVLSGEDSGEADTLGLSGTSADDFPSSDELLNGPDSLLVEVAEESDSAGISADSLLGEANRRQQAAQQFIRDARARVDTALALLDSISDYEDTAVLARRDEMVIELSRLLRQLGIMERAGGSSRNGEIPLQMNRFVEREIQSFQTIERLRFLSAYKRSGMYVPYIEGRLRAEGLPEHLAWLAFIESEFKARALSRARAAGLWQFIASTGYRYGLSRDRWVDERMDLERSTAAAIAYLRALHDLFGDWNTALAAYNSGEGRVLRTINRQRSEFMDDFWDLYIQLPNETARYVPRFHAVLQIIHDPTKFGFTDLPEPDPSLQYDTVIVNRQMRLSDVAPRLGVEAGQLELFNAHLRSYITPGYEFALRVPKGKADLLVQSVASIPVTKAPDLPEYVVHRVRSGETLGSIAQRYRTTVSAIQRANNIRDPRFIRAGQRLRVPTRAAGREAR